MDSKPVLRQAWQGDAGPAGRICYAAFKAIAERLTAEHVVVHELLERLVDALNALAAEPSPARFEEARTIYHALERVLLSHLGWEEDAMGDALGYFGLF